MHEPYHAPQPSLKLIRDEPSIHFFFYYKFCNILILGIQILLQEIRNGDNNEEKMQYAEGRHPEMRDGQSASLCKILFIEPLKPSYDDINYDDTL